jgi:HSP20 family molecular chaperone IbpA
MIFPLIVDDLLDMMKIDKAFSGCYDYYTPDSNPSVDIHPLYGKDNKTAKGIVIQMALAGFSDDDIKVWHDDKLLYIKGDRKSSRGLLDKFVDKFSYEHRIADNLDMKNSSVNLENGMLFIEIPFKEKKDFKRFLFGK